MLQVLHAGSTELSRTGADNGILLNCWDKSSPLIKELEQTVNFAERKCGDLMQQLNFYREYYQKWTQIERVNTCCKKKPKKCFRNALEIESSSENEFEKVNQYFYKKIKRKINEMSNEIIQVNRKLNSKKEIVPQTPLNFSLIESTPEPKSEPKVQPKTKHKSPKSKPKTPKQIVPEDIFKYENVENKRSKSDPTINFSRHMSSRSRRGSEVVVPVKDKKSSKSVPPRNKAAKAKLDKGNVKKRYSNLQRYKLRAKSLPQGVKRKFGFGGFYEVFEPDSKEGSRRTKSRMSIRTDSCKSSKSRRNGNKSKAKATESRRSITAGKNFRQMKVRTDTKTVVKNPKHEPPAIREEPPPVKRAPQTMRLTPQRVKQDTCQEIVPSVYGANLDVAEDLKTLIMKPNALVPFLRHPIPFIPCSSTSKTFNLGLNVQQVLSLIKHKRHSVTLQTVLKNSMQAASALTEPTVGTLFISQTTTSHTSAICPAREDNEDAVSFITDNRSKCSILRHLHTDRSKSIEENVISVPMDMPKPERPEDVWVVEQPDPTSKDERKNRSRCTCYPTKHCVDYHKVLRQYTGWRLPIGNGSNGNHCTPMITCTKSRLYAIPSQENIDGNGRTELMKVQNDLLNLTRKCSSLQELISQNCLEDYEANAELDAMESELAVREIEFKDILNFYNQLMSLKEKVRSLRAKNQSQSTQLQMQRPKKDPLRPTPSMALTKVLRKIQGLQDKIKLIDNP